MLSELEILQEITQSFLQVTQKGSKSGTLLILLRFLPKAQSMQQNGYASKNLEFIPWMMYFACKNSLDLVE
jgi:hypothetical protein